MESPKSASSLMNFGRSAMIEGASPPSGESSSGEPEARAPLGEEKVMSRDTLQSLGWALFGGVLFAVSPFTPDDLVPSIIAGFVAGALVLVYRLVIRRPCGDAVAVAARFPFSVCDVTGTGRDGAVTRQDVLRHAGVGV